MKITWKTLALLFLSSLGLSGFTQDLPEFQLQKEEVEFQLRFLASDELQGRRTGSRENNIAARFIAAHLQSYGYKPAPGLDSYLQEIPFVATTPPPAGSLAIGKSSYEYKKDFIILSGEAAIVKTPGVFAGHGWVDEAAGHNDYKELDVAGKVVFVLPGTPEGNDPQTMFMAMRKKRALAEERGAVALIELFRLKFPWEFFLRFFSRESLGIAKDEEDQKGNKIVYGWIREKSREDIANVQQGKKAKVTLSGAGYASRSMPSSNVIGVLEGSDPELKDEYMLITAHFDHVGAGKDGGGAYTEEDSIFNGARDNGIGTVALLSAARALALKPPKRSVIILAVTGEEIGLLGSGYYASNPLIPLNKTVLNLNTDGGGYNNTKALSAFGAMRTGVDELVAAGASAFDLEVIHNPAPNEGLYDRSDNVSFARKGIPAVSLSPGFDEFDEEIRKHYHQVSDEAGSVDFDYLLRFCRAFSHIARLLGDSPNRPVWAEGDKYQKAGEELYKN